MLVACLSQWSPSSLMYLCGTRGRCVNDASISLQHICGRWRNGTTAYHDDVIKWKHFPRNWPFVREIHRSPVNFPHKGQWRQWRLNKRLSKQPWGWWFETPAWSLWRHRNDNGYCYCCYGYCFCYRYCHYLYWRTHLVHWGWDKMDAIWRTTFSNAFSRMKIFEFRLTFHWGLFPRVQLTILQHWFRYWLAPARRQAIIWTNDG